MALNFAFFADMLEQAGSVLVPPAPIKMVTRLRRPPVNSVKEFAWYAASVACPPDTLRDWSCKSCRVATDEPLSDVVPFKNVTSGAAGYFGIDHRRRTILVAFRATDNIENFIHSFEFSQVPFEDAEDPDTRVHNGFLDSINSVNSYFMPPLRRALEDSRTKAYSVTLVGVSLGAAEAALAAFQIHRQLNVSWARIAVYAFAMPRTGNVAFVRAFNSKPMTAARTVNYNDLIPHVPTAYKYAHIQHELFVDRSQPTTTTRFCNATVLEDPTCGNAILPFTYDMNQHYYVWDTKFDAKLAC